MLRKIARNLYSVLPFKKQIFSVLKKFHLPESVYKHLYFTGVLKVTLEKGESFWLNHYGYQLENEIFWEGLPGRWEKYSISLWIDLCKKSKVIFDIGANTGVYSLVAKTINSSAEVYAFEPVQVIYNKLLENRDRNKFSINCFLIALSDKNGTMPIYGSTDFSYTASLTKAFYSHAPTPKSVDVEVNTLAHFIEKNRITQIDLMKIDVESHEPEVLAGFGTYLEKFRPVILIEIIREYVLAGVMPYFEKINYVYFNIDEVKGVRQVDKVGVSDSFNYLFCPAEKAKQLNLL